MFGRINNFAKYLVKLNIYRVKCKKNQSNIVDILSGSESSVLFITHNFKGGTVQYEENFVKENNNKVIVVKIITQGKILAYNIINTNTNHNLIISRKSISDILGYKFKSIIVNSLVSANNYSEIQASLQKYKIIHPNSKVIYLVHDYHSICPKYNLVYKNKFCNLRCEENHCKNHYYPECTKDSITKWRRNWEYFFNTIDYIVCFSNSSKELLKNIYSNIDDNKIYIKPHDMSWCNFPIIDKSIMRQGNIAIVGTCNTVAKGKKVIQEILKKTNERFRFVLIGTKKEEIKTKRINVIFTGRYKHDELRDLLIKYNISLVVFPSIWPETFSYLVSEIIQMNLELVCFDYGAQAEKTKLYKNGTVVNNSNEMIKFIESKYII
jgi:glycosyltransferase involved in cell wall biosynthesis